MQAMIKQKFQFRLLADYHQFEVRDENAIGDVSIGWTDQTVRELLVVTPDAIGIGTVRNAYVPVEVIVQNEPEVSCANDWSQIAECDVSLNSGGLLIIDGETYLPNAIRINVIPHRYRLRIYYANLDSVAQNDTEGDDFYRLVMWPTDRANVVVFIKRWR